MGDGVRIRFWKDKWREGDLTLQDKYPALYQVSTQQNHSINSMGLLYMNIIIFAEQKKKSIVVGFGRIALFLLSLIY